MKLQIYLREIFCRVQVLLYANLSRAASRLKYISRRLAAPPQWPLSARRHSSFLMNLADSRLESSFASERLEGPSASLCDWNASPRLTLRRAGKGGRAEKDVPVATLIIPRSYKCANGYEAGKEIPPRSEQFRPKKWQRESAPSRQLSSNPL